MIRYIVTKTRMELSVDRSHRHIEGLCLASGSHFTRREVAASIAAGNDWLASLGGGEARIRAAPSCPRCDAAPYITTAPDDGSGNLLTDLPAG